MERREERKDLVENLREEWKNMWRSRFDDKVRAEGIADRTYDRLFVDRGTILFATRKYKPVEFREVLEKYMSTYDVDTVVPDPNRGGIGKFIREHITRKSEFRSRGAILEESEERKKDSVRQNVKGWLHLSMRGR